jgi:hypothetical protein
MDPAHPCTGRAPLPQSSKRRSCISIQSSFFYSEMLVPICKSIATVGKLPFAFPQSFATPEFKNVHLFSY